MVVPLCLIVIEFEMQHLNGSGIITMLLGGGFNEEICMGLTMLW